MSKKPYQLYIDGMEIPITPSKIKNKISGQNDFYDLVNGETYTVLRRSKLQEYAFSFYACSLKSSVFMISELSCAAA